MDLSLQHKRALVCGSSQGIGRAVAFQFAHQGASVVLAGRNEARLREICASLPAQAHQSHAYLVADFSDPSGLKAAVEAHLAAHPGLEILVNNTGGPAPGPAHLADPASFLAAFQQHLICNQLLVQALLPGMQAKQYGRVINIISTSVKQPIAGLGVSNTIRGAVASWAKTLAGELGPFGITVNNVLPGPTRTQRLEQIFENRSKKTGKPRDEVIAEELAQVPAKRFAEPEEIACAVGFLASPCAGFINGVNLPIDGGRTLSL